MTTRQQALDRQRKLFPGDDLVTICQALRGGVNGSADAWKDKDVKEAVELLKMRLACWEPNSLPIENKVDDAVRCLVAATLELVEFYSVPVDSIARVR